MNIEFMSSVDSGYCAFQGGTSDVSHVFHSRWLGAFSWYVMVKQVYHDNLLIFVIFKATHYSFIHEIPMLARYEVRTSIAAWDRKWVCSSLYY